MEGQARLAVAAEQGEHVEDGHEKKSMFHSVKDRVKKMNAKVKKNIRSRQGHRENLQESGGEEEEEENDEEEQDQARRKSDENVVDVETLKAQNNPNIINYKDDTPIKELMRAKEDQNEDLFHSNETEQGRSATGIAVPITEIEETKTDVGTPSTTDKAGVLQAEATESTPQDKASEVGEGNELISNTKPSNVTEKLKSGPSANVPEEVESDQSAPSEIGFGVMSKASGLAQGLKGMLSSKKSSDDDVKDTTLLGDGDGGAQQQQTEAQGVDNALENSEEFESNSGPKLSENPEEEESQSLARDTLGKVNEGKGIELASNTKPPNPTEEVNSGNSEDIMLRGELQGKEDEEPQQQESEAERECKTTGPNSSENRKEEESQILARKAQDKVSEVGEGDELVSNMKPPNFTEEVKSGTPETGSGFMKETSGLALGLKDIFPHNQSSNDNVKNTVLQGENKGKEEGGPQQLQSEAEAKAGQGYAQKLYAAKDAVTSKLGYGGQTNHENNGTRELKSANPIQGPTSGSGTEATEDAKEGKKTPIVSKLSPGEDEKALSMVITEAVSNSAISVKDTIVGGFYGGKEKTSATTMDPSQSPSSNASGGEGIVDRVTGVVGSFVGRKQGEDAQICPSSQEQELDSVVQVQKQMSELQAEDDQPTGKSGSEKEESTPMEQ
ncbi:hypothetical protein KI387_035920 [Taxus chinensis]|uniref:LTI65/LTI78 PGEED repeat domain-containing protein n=1 Tax=Taxus chinensis TaxID=29808 RepID=A0AA38FQ75_TAXCH|nr:hypothetical protein KI387_035920 [Taxus chinensis]